MLQVVNSWVTIVSIYLINFIFVPKPKDLAKQIKLIPTQYFWVFLVIKWIWMEIFDFDRQTMNDLDSWRVTIWAFCGWVMCV